MDSVLNRAQSAKLGQMAANALGKKMGLKGNKLALANRAGAWAGLKAGKLAGQQVTKLTGFKKGGVIVIHEAPKKRGRKSKK